MRLIATILGFVILSQAAIGQNLNPILSGNNEGNTVGMFAIASARSNMLRVKFLRDFYTGKSIDSDLREKQANASLKINRAGADLNYGLYYRHMPDTVTQGWGWGVQLGARLHSNAAFTADGYKLAMLGNAQFAGQTAELSGTQFNLFNYKYLGGSVIKDISIKHGLLKIGFSANFLLAQKQSTASFDEASLFTQEFGEYLDFSAQGTFTSNGLSSSHYLGANGFGFSTDLLVQLVRPKHTISLELGDAGALFMNNNGSATSIDTSFRFEGIALDLFEEMSEPFSSLSPDSLSQTLGISTDSAVAHSAALPAFIHVRSEHDLKDGKISVFGGIQYRFAPYFPLIYAGAKFNLPSLIAIQPTFAWGGYGSWNVGLELEKRFNDIATLSLGTNNLEGFIVANVATGQSAYVNLAVHF